ncbi:MAG TPA: hypothetical protein VLH79_13475 [Chthonomonadales bacterium]|nr:hypothetical protein [Chthonomonadales bacterium]
MSITEEGRTAILLDLIHRLGVAGSWCGETHIQKAVYFLQEAAGQDLGFQYLLYKHGPYSFELRDELYSLWALGQLALKPQEPPYGPRWEVVARHARTGASGAQAPAAGRDELAAVVEWLGDKGVVELERLSTALWARSEMPDQPEPARAARVRELKPHIGPEEAAEAVAAVERMLSAARPAHKP